MRADPLQLDPRLRLRERVEFLHEFEVLDRAALAFPTALFPAVCPLIDRIHAELAVRVRDEIRFIGQMLESFDQCFQFHAIIGGVRFAAVALGKNFSALDPDPSPTARTGVRVAGAVGEDARVGTSELGFEYFFGGHLSHDTFGHWRSGS